VNVDTDLLVLLIIPAIFVAAMVFMFALDGWVLRGLRDKYFNRSRNEDHE